MPKASVAHGATHVVIPDTQVKPGVPIDHLAWIGQYIVDKFAGRPNVKIVHLGDHWDMCSLSSYDKGKKAMEGRRYMADIAAGNRGFEVLNAAFEAHDCKQRRGNRLLWTPEKHLLRGNHENRIQRAIDADAQMDGLLNFDDLKSPGWEVHGFLEPVELDGICYAHYLYNPMSGRPYTGMIETRLKQVGRSFTQGHQQTLAYGVRYVGKRSQHGLVAGACLTPDHRVLTADLRYVELGTVKPGDQLVSFDEEVRGRRSRRYKTGTVGAVKMDTEEVFAVTLDNGKVFKVTADHLWLARVGGQSCVKNGGTYWWRRTDQLRVGSVIPRVLDEWETLTSHGAGYLAGLYDGEGCYYIRQTTGGHACQLGLSQKPGVVLDLATAELGRLVGVDGVTETNQNGVCNLRIKGGMPGIVKVLGQVRPARLLPKFRPEHMAGMKSTQGNKIVEIRPIGRQEIVRIDVDAKTMIVEGYPHHNCYLHEEDYMGPQGVGYWRGIVVCHEVENGSYDPMFVSLDFLCRRYENRPLSAFKPKVFA